MSIPAGPKHNLTAIKWLTFLMFMMFAMTTDSVGLIIPEIIKQYGLNQPAYVQYWNWLVGVKNPLTGERKGFKVAEEGVRLEAVAIDIDERTGKARSIVRVQRKLEMVRD